MQNILAALLGGVGAGAQSLGGSMQMEEEKKRLEQQRMNELIQAHTARIQERNQEHFLKQQDDQTEAAQAAAALKAMNPDFPTNVDVNKYSLPMIRERLIGNRQQELSDSRAADDRTRADAKSLADQQGAFNALADIHALPKDMEAGGFQAGRDYKGTIAPRLLNDSRAADALTRGIVLGGMHKGSEPSDGQSDKDVQIWTNKRVASLLRPTKNSVGLPNRVPTMQEATQQAQSEIPMVFPSRAGSAPAPQAAPAPTPGAMLMGGLGVGAGAPRPATDVEVRAAMLEAGKNPTAAQVTAILAKKGLAH